LLVALARAVNGREALAFFVIARNNAGIPQF